MLDEAQGETFAEIVRGYVERATAPLVARIAELEARAPLPGPVGEKGPAGPGVVEAMINRDGCLILTMGDGRLIDVGQVVGKEAPPVEDHPLVLQLSVDTAQLRRELDAAIQAIDTTAKTVDERAEAAAQMIELKFQAPVITDEWLARMREIAAASTERAIAAAIKSHEEPTEEPPAPVMSDEDIERIFSLDRFKTLEAGVERISVFGERLEALGAEVAAVAALPAPKDGRDGKDAPDVVGAVKDHTGELILTLSNGQMLNTGIRDGAPGAKGVDGKDGRDGFGLEDFDAEVLEDGRTLLLSFERDGLKQTIELALPINIDRGVYKDGETYQRGDGVTWAGSYWYAQKETATKPGDGADWRLAVKKGRDGKDGAPGENGLPGSAGPPGRDGRTYT